MSSIGSICSALLDSSWGRRPSRGAVRRRVKLPSQGAPSAGKACDIRVAPGRRRLSSGFAALRTAPMVSAVAAIGAESEYGKGVKACRAEPGHSTCEPSCINNLSRFRKSARTRGSALSALIDFALDSRPCAYWRALRAAASGSRTRRRADRRPTEWSAGRPGRCLRSLPLLPSYSSSECFPPKLSPRVGSRLFATHASLHAPGCWSVTSNAPMHQSIIVWF